MDMYKLTQWSSPFVLFILGAVTVKSAEPFRPVSGEFPPLQEAHSYRGELAFVDHANRRGSLRVEGTGKFYRNDPHPFAMLPYGVIRYQGTPPNSAIFPSFK